MRLVRYLISSLMVFHMAFAGPIDEVNLADNSKLFPEVDFKSIDKIKLQCRSSGPELLNTKNCKELKEQILSMAKARVTLMTHDYYEGKSVNDWVTGESKQVQKPVCNLTAGEKDKNALKESCGPMCNIKIDTDLGGGDGRLTGPCAKESAYSRGAYVQILNHFAEKAFDEFQEGTLSLVDFDGRRPSAPMAADTIRMQEGHEKVMSEFIAVDGEEKLAKSECKEQTDRLTSMAPCRMQAGQNYIASQWAMLLAHEISSRTAKEFYHSWPVLLGGASGCISSRCKGAAKCKDCSDGERSDKATRCYHSNLDSCLAPLLEKYKTKEKIKISVEGNQKEEAKR